MTSNAECGKGWSGRCAAAKSKKCRCRCGGENHGKARPSFVVNIEPSPEIDELLALVVEETIRPLDFVPRIIERFDYEGLHGRHGTTHLAICGKVVIATEREDNPGASITNAAENLWAKVREQFGDDIIAVEHYPVRGPRNQILLRSYDLVTIRNGSASWSRLSRERLASLIADPSRLEVPDGAAVTAVA